jgi:hypothetical protein
MAGKFEIFKEGAREFRSQYKVAADQQRKRNDQVALIVVGVAACLFMVIVGIIIVGAIFGSRGGHSAAWQQGYGIGYSSGNNEGLRKELRSGRSGDAQSLCLRTMRIDSLEGHLPDGNDVRTGYLTGCKAGITRVRSRFS